MTLNDWLTSKGLTPTDLARRMNRPQATIARYATGKRIPEPPIMKEIFDVTDGAVTPNDFYGCGTQAAPMKVSEVVP